ncbi:EAL domain-containing protein [Orrella sp. JC864]|uniref:sensor domain-containing protein n=1 Tax=Orrella sp. JC864 TaxID=3120298 RepID=UPI0030086AAC
MLTDLPSSACGNGAFDAPPAPPSPDMAWRQSPCAAFICDPQGVFTHVNEAFEALTGHTAAELAGRLRHTDLLRDCPERAGPALAAWAGQGGAAPLHRACTCRHKNGSRLPLMLAMRPAHDAQGRCCGLLGTLLPRDEASPDLSLLWRLPEHRAGAGLPNQTWLEERLALKIARSRQGQGRFLLALIEADKLDRVRDSLGAEALASTLGMVAARLRALLGPGESLACVDESRFAVLSEAHEDDFAHRVRQWLRQLALPCGGGALALRLTASAGLCRGEGTAEPAALLRRASLALAAARQDGGGQLRWFEPGMQSRAVGRLELESLLRAGLDKQEFRLVFQPQLHLASGEIRLMEALVRWQHPVRGTVSPAEFIPVAEQSGLILDLGAWVMDQACRQASQLLRKLGSTPMVSVNVSPVQFQNQDLPQVVQRCLQAHGLQGRHLEIELTEGVLLGDTEAALQTLDALRELGVSVAIDDFGTGYSSLAYLTRMRADRLKIDRSFIVRMLHDTRSAAIVSAVIAMAHALGLRVTAEGVETQEQADKLQQMGCDEVQGYWFSRPLAAEALAHVLAPL